MIPLFPSRSIVIRPYRLSSCGGIGCLTIDILTFMNRVKLPGRRTSSTFAATTGYDALARYDPRTAAWLSAMFPGFGHLLLNHNVRGAFFTLSEVFVNSLARVNESMVLTFCGRFEEAKNVLSPNWAVGYAVIYLYVILDSYRLAIGQNRVQERGFRGVNPLAALYVKPHEYQYMSEKRPWIAVVYSCLVPGLGQIYVQRYWLGMFGVIWWWVYGTLSGFNVACVRLLLGKTEGAAMLHPHWLLFIPSLIGGAVYHSYTSCLRQNRLFRAEQRRYLEAEYQRASLGTARYRSD